MRAAGKRILGVLQELEDEVRPIGIPISASKRSSTDR
jgi:hypothetical protein